MLPSLELLQIVTLQMKIAILEDDQDQAELLNTWMQAAGHDSTVFGTGSAYRQALKKETYDLLILDWNLPDTSGPDILAWVRENLDWHIPVIFITSRDNESDIVQALNSGADDYMIKPVRQQETMARLQALGRRTVPGMTEEKSYLFPPYRIEVEERNFLLDDEPVALRSMEFDLALFLFRNAGRLLSRNYIMENVWGTQADINTRTVDTHISRLRSKLNIKPEMGWKLSAVYHHGYRLEKLAGDSE